VHVSTEQVVERRASPFPTSGPVLREFFRDFHRSASAAVQRTTSLGSGVIVAADGTIMTNRPRDRRASRIHVTLADQREFDATLVGAGRRRRHRRGPGQDGRRPAFIALGRSADLMIGESVIASGTLRTLAHGHDRRGERGRRSLHDETAPTPNSSRPERLDQPGELRRPAPQLKASWIGITPHLRKAQGSASRSPSTGRGA